MNRAKQREGNFFFFAVAWPRDDHLHIGLPPPTLIDKYTGGAPRNEGPPPLSLLLYFFQRGPPLSVNSFDVDQLLYLSLPSSSLSSSSFPPTFVPFVHPVCYEATTRCSVCRPCVERIRGWELALRRGKKKKKKRRGKKKKIVTGNKRTGYTLKNMNRRDRGEKTLEGHSLTASAFSRYECREKN